MNSNNQICLTFRAENFDDIFKAINERKPIGFQNFRDTLKIQTIPFQATSSILYLNANEVNLFKIEKN